MLVHNFFENDARVLRESAALADAGHALEVVAVRGPRNAASERIGRLGVTRLDCDPLPTKLIRRILAAMGRQRPGASGTVGEIGSLGGAIASSGLGRSALRLHLWLTHRKFVRRATHVATAKAPDVVVAHDLDTLEPAHRAARRLGVRLVYDSHELWLDREPIPPPTRFGRSRWRRLEHRLIGEADLVVTVSDLLANELVRRYGIEQPSVIRNLPSTAGKAAGGESLRARVGVAADAPVALYLGGLMRDRGIEELVAAAPGVEGLHVLLVGSGEPRYVAAIEAEADRLRIPDRVHLAGSVPSSRAVRAASEADVGLVANLHGGLNHQYTLPNRLFTYLAAGVPVVGNHSPAFERLILDNEVGATCDPRSHGELASALRWVLDPARHERLRANARALAARENWESEARLLLEAYARLERARR